MCITGNVGCEQIYHVLTYILKHLVLTCSTTLLLRSFHLFWPSSVFGLNTSVGLYLVEPCFNSVS